MTARNCSFPDAVILSVTSSGLSPLTRDICDMSEYEARVRKQKCLYSHSILTPQYPRRRLKKLFEETSKAFSANKNFHELCLRMLPVERFFIYIYFLLHLNLN